MVRRFCTANARPVLVAAVLYAVGVAIGAALTPGSVQRGADTAAGAAAVLLLLQHNALVVLALSLGGLTLGLSTLLVLVSNGATVGLAVTVALRSTSATDVLLAIAPHGVLEIPATLLAGAAGLKVMQSVYARTCGRPTPSMAAALSDAVVLTSLALCLVVLAAPLEVYVSLHLPAGAA